MSDLTPDQIRRAGFRTTLRGLDPSEVRGFLDRIAAELESLVEERERLAERAGTDVAPEMAAELDRVGQEVTRILQTAREAAEAMRERAGLDASRWRAEATAEAEQTLKQARSDAEALRGDAWATGTELLNQAMAEARRVQKEAEREAITITGEAEREAHRLVSHARREAEDTVRSASMDAEKMTAEATKRHDEILEQAFRQAESAEERTRALEERRQELLEELEHVRTTLGRLESTLEERRESLKLSESSVRVVPTARGEESDDPATWTPGETVRIVQKGPVPPPARPEPGPLAEEVVRDVEKLRRPPVREPQPETEEPETPAEAVEAEAVEAEEVEAPAVVEEGGDEVGALFASLRGGGAKTEVAEQAPVREAEPAPVTGEWLEQRDSILLPITNRALRGVKKSVTDAQNLALDSLRTDEGWAPDTAALAELMRADLIGLWAEGFAAGHTAAEAMVDGKLRRPATPHSDAADDFAAALSTAVETALTQAGDGQRERQAAASRVFRSWRTDEAERRIRALALRAYHRGLAESAGAKSTLSWIPGGTPCSACRTASKDPAHNLPPVHPGCECTVVVAG